MRKHKTSVLLWLVSGGIIMVAQIAVFIYSYNDLSEPLAINLYRWTLTVSLIWLIMLRLRDILNEDHASIHRGIRGDE